MITASSRLTTPWRLGILALLALVMLATRSHLLNDHFMPLPDASWAVFLIAGFYLRGSGRWAFPLLMALAVAIDYVVISSQGIGFWQHYCVSPAYWFLVPSYGVLWLGGSWLRSRYAGMHARELGLLLGSVVVATSACYLISNGSFYWLSPSVPVRSFAGWMENLGDWYPSFLRTTLIYVGVAVVLHAFAAQALRWLPAAADRATRR